MMRCLNCVRGNSKTNKTNQPKQEPELSPLPMQDFTLEQLTEWDGKNNEGRILIAVLGKVFDVTKGKRFYGPEGPYGVLAGHDASRALATFFLGGNALRTEYDDLSDLDPSQLDSVRGWEAQFQKKYVYVGRLLKPGEQPADYNDKNETV